MSSGWAGRERVGEQPSAFERQGQKAPAHLSARCMPDPIHQIDSGPLPILHHRGEKQQHNTPFPLNGAGYVSCTCQTLPPPVSTDRDKKHKHKHAERHAAHSDSEGGGGGDDDEDDLDL